VWDSYQQERLGFENSMLLDNHPHCEVFIGDSYAEAKLWHLVKDMWYRLRIEISSSYPDEKPKVYVESPVPLRAYLTGKNIRDYAPSHNYHVLSTSSRGEVQICHFSADDWDATKSIHLVVLKAKLWLQAYGEHHLTTGRPICDFFGDCV
jgi:hypothetical protein